MELTQIDNERKGYLLATENNTEAGRMEYTHAGKDKFIIDHTDVNPDYNGKGVGKKLLMQAVEYARNNDKKIMPLCPFAKSMFDKLEDIRDVLF